jgi:hypothetical protein
MYKKIDKCRICGNPNLDNVLDLGEQVLTGVFPHDKNSNITKGPLRLVKCTGEDDFCGLLQLEHSYDLGEMYGENYGYRSGLNASMVKHLHEKVEKILTMVELQGGDLVVDIGSNDSTTLQAYPSAGPILVGIDPTGVKFHKYYPPHIQLIPNFFSSTLLKEKFPGKQVNVITSFSMFYDLEDPMAFMRGIHDVLADDGIWVFEQSYMPTMLEMNSYDTVCHEHLEYYSLSQIKWMADRVGFSIIDVEFNDINGGSFSVTAKKALKNSDHSLVVDKILKHEKELGLGSLEPYISFAKRVEQNKNDLLAFISNAKRDKKTVCALGASTKGNVILQYCELTEEDIPFVGEVNPEKYGCYTPGTLLPIIPEDKILEMNPEYLIILPWHFKKFFLENDKFSNCSLVSPLPEVRVLN